MSGERVACEKIAELHQVGYTDRALEAVRAMPVNDAERARIPGGNAAALLKL